MNVEHKDINKFIPYGEMLRGYSSQNLISKADIDRILRERGIFALNQEKAYTVPILQTLLLSPKEFEELRHSFSEKYLGYLANQFLLRTFSLSRKITL